MKTYDSYKNSGIEWIGEIPDHWAVKKLKHSFKLIMGQSPNSTDCNLKRKGVPFLQGNADFNSTFPIPQNWCENPTKIAPSNSILLSVRAPIGAVNIADQEYCIGRGLCALVSNNSRFLYFSTLCLNDELNSLGTGSTFKAVSIEQISNTYTTIPPSTEQTGIANYLDRKTAEIDELISNKKHLLELYEDEKTCIINQAVTKGINLDVPMKDSGIEWLGEIPEHWELKRIRHVANIFGRIGYRGYKTTDLVSKGNGAITISPSNMKDFNMDFSNCTYLSWDKYDESPEIKIKNGDILFVKTGSTYGKSSLVEKLPEKATINPQIIVLKEIQCNNHLLWYNIKSKYIQFQVEGTVVGGTIPTISQAKINNYEFALSPDLNEQQRIVEFINKECKRINTKIKRTKKLIELLKEYRTSLISEVVTGKVKVVDGVG